MENGVNLQTQLNSENQFLTLLVDGVQAFPEIIKEIENAKKSININMFICALKISVIGFLIL